MDKDRIYHVGDKRVQIPFRAIEKFFAWGKAPFDQNQQIDRKFVRLLVVCCGTGAVDQPILMFVRRLLNLRVEGDIDRVDAIDSYVEEFAA